LSYEGLFRRGTSLERKARASALIEELSQKVTVAEQASAWADKLGTYNDHVAASRAWRRVIGPASRLDQDTTIYREHVSRHIEAAELIRRQQHD
jgi:hypothetical protein